MAIMRPWYFAVVLPVILAGAFAFWVWFIWAFLWDPGPCSRCSMPWSWHPQTTGHEYDRQYKGVI